MWEISYAVPPSSHDPYDGFLAESSQIINQVINQPTEPTNHPTNQPTN